MMTTPSLKCHIKTFSKMFSIISDPYGNPGLHYPALHPNVICVGSSDDYGSIASDASRHDKVAFLCPSHNIISTCNDG